MATVGDKPQCGVYTLGSYANNYPTILDFTYPISLADATSDDGFSTDNLEIGAVTVCGSDLFVSWYDHDTATYGVDMLDYSTKLSGAYFITKLYSVVREQLSSFIQFLVAFNELPTGTSIEMKYSLDYGVTWNTTTEIIDTVRQITKALETAEGSTLMFRVILTTYQGVAPVIDSAGVLPN